MNKLMGGGYLISYGVFPIVMYANYCSQVGMQADVRSDIWADEFGF
jgi:hypothetical protein